MNNFRRSEQTENIDMSDLQRYPVITAISNQV